MAIIIISGITILICAVLLMAYLVDGYELDG